MRHSNSNMRRANMCQHHLSSPNKRVPLVNFTRLCCGFHKLYEIVRGNAIWSALQYLLPHLLQHRCLNQKCGLLLRYQFEVRLIY